MAIFEPIPTDDQTRRYRVISPVDFEIIGEFDAAPAEAVRSAVERAKKILAPTTQRRHGSSGRSLAGRRLVATLES